MTTIKRITITNPTRRRGWGWNYSTTPTGQDAWSISGPGGPAITGTIKQIEQAIRTDHTYQSLRSGGTFINVRWYYRGQPIHDTKYLMETLDYLEYRRPIKSMSVYIVEQEKTNA